MEIYRRRTVQGCIALLVTAVSASMIVFAQPASAVAAPAKPTGFEVHMVNNLQEASLNWNGVTGAKSYCVTVRPTGIQGPYACYTATTNTYVVPYDKFPRNGAGGSVTFQVDACNSGGCSVAQATVKTNFGSGVSTSNKQSAADKANSCFAKGDAAGVSTLAGGGIIAAIDSWVPGANLVTAAGVGAATLGATGGTFVACELGF